MGTYRIKSVSRGEKGYRKAVKGELKQGDNYYWFDLVSKKITHEGLVYDPESKIPIESYYIRELDCQIGWGHIYVKK